MGGFVCGGKGWRAVGLLFWFLGVLPLVVVECLTLLSAVRMFGTENRPTDNPVAARDEVFEFIIFRGQDIKDIRLCEPPAPHSLPYDPAIVQVVFFVQLGKWGVSDQVDLLAAFSTRCWCPRWGWSPAAV